MKIFLSFVKKEFLHVLRDRRSLLILLGLPVVMMLLFGFALSNEVKNSRFVVIDPARELATQTLVNRLDESKYFSFVGYLEKPADIEPFFKQGKARLAIVIQEGYNTALQHGKQASLQLVADATDPNVATTVINYASLIIGDIQDELLGTQKLPYPIHLHSRMVYNPQLKSVHNFVPGVMTVILMLLGAMMTSVSIVREKELGTMEVLLVSPIQPLVVIFSKATPYLLLCFIDVCIILLLSYTVLELPMRGNLLLLLAECILFILTTLSLGMLISASVQSQQVAMFISLVGLLMPAIVFSGFMFPIENMPKVLQVISHVVPTRWFFQIVRDIMVKGLGFAYVAKETLILFGMTLFFFAMAMRRFKIRLEG